MTSQRKQRPLFRKIGRSFSNLEFNPSFKSLSLQPSTLTETTTLPTVTAKKSKRKPKVKRRAWTTESTELEKLLKERTLTQTENQITAIQRFRRVARMVRILSAVSLTIRQYSRSRDEDGFLLELRQTQRKLNSKSALEEKNRPLNPDFDKETFSRDKTLHFPLWARIICSKPSSERRLEECMRLCSFLRGMNSFTKFPRSVQLKLSERMTYNYYDKHRIIIRQGHKAYNFYFLLSGSLSVNIDTIDNKTGVKLTVTIDILKPPISFGENAFVQNDIRTASIVSNEKVEVLVLNRSDFYNFCWDHVKKENERKEKFLRSLPFFDSWEPQSLRLILHDVKQVQFPLGKLIEKNAQHSRYIYFVMEGSIDIIYSIDRRLLRRLDAEKDPVVRGATAGVMNPFPAEHRSILVEGGSLVANNAWGIETLLDQIPPLRRVNICLESCGCCVVQIARKRLLELAPRGLIENYVSDYRPPFRLLEDDEICRKYLQIHSWKEYKQGVVKSVVDVRNPESMCFTQPVSRGSSRSIKWTGLDLPTLPPLPQLPNRCSREKAMSLSL